MNTDIWYLYLFAVIGLCITPGPNVLLALSHGAIYGVRMATFTILGGAVGFTLVIAMSMFGIGALIKSSIVWFTILKWVGGAYLIWLGIQVWRSPPIVTVVKTSTTSVKRSSLFVQGLLSAATNPKAILFFVAFLPQFIDPARSLLTQFILMTSTFVSIEIVFELFLADSSRRIQGWLGRSGRGFNRTCGSVFVVIGIALPFRE